MPKRREKLQPVAVPLDILPERRTMTIHPEISARGLLIPAGDDSNISSCISLQLQNDCFDTLLNTWKSCLIVRICGRIEKIRAYCEKILATLLNVFAI